jgi:hypothetical protein
LSDSDLSDLAPSRGGDGANEVGTLDVSRGCNDGWVVPVVIKKRTESVCVRVCEVCVYVRVCVSACVCVGRRLISSGGGRE